MRLSRVEIYKALGGVHDPALLQRAFDYALSGKVDLRETMEIYETAGDDGMLAPALFAYVRDHYEALAARLQQDARGRLPRRHMTLCSAHEREALKAFYAGERGATPGLQRNLAQALETVDICIRTRELNAAR